MPSSEHSHDPQGIRLRLSQQRPKSYLAAAVLGAIDGCVTTVAIVAGAAGAGVAPPVALILGAANLLADGFSMAASNYEAVRGEAESLSKVRRIEKRHIRDDAEGERDEVRALLEQKGFRGDLLESIVDHLTTRRSRWIEFMIQEEYGMSLQTQSPAKAAAVTFAAFVTVGLAPLLPFALPIWSGDYSRLLATAVLALTALFSIGAVKGALLNLPRWRAGLRTMLVGGAAAGIAFACGYVLEPLLIG